MGKIMANISQMEATGEFGKYHFNLRPSKYRVSSFKVFIVLEQDRIVWYNLQILFFYC
jgi:hypothetical protein